MTPITKPASEGAHEFYWNYINQVDSNDLMQALKAGHQATRALFNLGEAAGDFRYAPGKWTIKELLHHMLDTERVFAFRALWFARQSPDPLPGFEQDDWTPAAETGRRTLESLLEEFDALRHNTLELFGGFSHEQLDRTGIASGNPMSTRACGYVIAGHAIHHGKVLQERYLPGLASS